MNDPITLDSHISRCSRCETEFAPRTLACPACGALAYAAELRRLAETAADLTAAGALGDARNTWEQALEFLPAYSDQHRQISNRFPNSIAGSRLNNLKDPAPTAATDEPGGREDLRARRLQLRYSPPN